MTYCVIMSSSINKWASCDDVVHSTLLPVLVVSYPLRFTFFVFSLLELFFFLAHLSTLCSGWAYEMGLVWRPSINSFESISINYMYLTDWQIWYVHCTLLPVLIFFYPLRFYVLFSLSLNCSLLLQKLIMKRGFKIVLPFFCIWFSRTEYGTFYLLRTNPYPF